MRPRNEPRDTALVVHVGLAELDPEPPFLVQAADIEVEAETGNQGKHGRRHQRRQPQEGQSGAVERMPHIAIEPARDELRWALVRGFNQLAQAKEVPHVGLVQAGQDDDHGGSLPGQEQPGKWTGHDI